MTQLIKNLGLVLFMLLSLTGNAQEENASVISLGVGYKYNNTIKIHAADFPMEAQANFGTGFIEYAYNNKTIFRLGGSTLLEEFQATDNLTVEKAYLFKFGLGHNFYMTSADGIPSRFQVPVMIYLGSGGIKWKGIKDYATQYLWQAEISPKFYLTQKIAINASFSYANHIKNRDKPSEISFKLSGISGGLLFSF